MTIRFAAGRVLIAVALVLLPTPAGSAGDPVLQPAPFRPAAVGSVFHWNVGDVIVGAREGYFVHYTLNGKPHASSLVAFAGQDYLSDDDKARLAAIWPLTIGRTVTFHRRDPGNQSVTWEDRVTVARTETVTVGGAPIDSYVLEWSSRGELRNSWQGKGTLWYAPALGWTVRLRYEDNRGVRNDEDVRSFQLAPAATSTG